MASFHGGVATPHFLRLSAGDDVGGIAVHLATRVMSEADAGQVVVTRTVKDLTAGSGLSFEDLGIRPLRGIPDPWQLLLLRTSSSATARAVLRVRRARRRDPSP